MRKPVMMIVSPLLTSASSRSLARSWSALAAPLLTRQLSCLPYLSWGLRPERSRGPPGQCKPATVETWERRRTCHGVAKREQGRGGGKGGKQEQRRDELADTVAQLPASSPRPRRSDAENVLYRFDGCSALFVAPQVLGPIAAALSRNASETDSQRIRYAAWTDSEADAPPQTEAASSVFTSREKQVDLRARLRESVSVH